MLENSRQTAPNSDLCAAERVNPSAESDAPNSAAKPNEPSPRGDADAQRNVAKVMDVENGAQTRRKKSSRKKSRRRAPEVEIPEVEILDLDLPPGPSSAWEDPEIIMPLLESNDPREAHLVKALIHREYELYAHLERSVKSRDADEAVREFRVVDNVGHALVKTAENLAEHRYGGVQNISVLEYSGPTVGLGNEIQQRKQPKPGSPAAHLVKRLHVLECDLDEAASRFGVQSLVMLDRISQYPEPRPVQWCRDAEKWENLRAKTLKLMVALSGVVNKLERGHRQIVVKTPERSNGDKARAWGLPHDTETRHEDTTSPPRQPVAN